MNGIAHTGNIKAGINVGKLAAGQTVIITFDVTLANPLPLGDGQIENVATTNGGKNPTPVITIFTPVITLPTDTAKLIGTKTVTDGNGNGIAEAGETLTYTITYKNEGTKATTEDVIIEDTLADTEFAGAIVSNLQVDGVSHTGDVKTGINVGKLAVGQSVTLTFDVTLASPLPAGDGTIRNIATANGEETSTAVAKIPTKITSKIVVTGENNYKLVIGIISLVIGMVFFIWQQHRANTKIR